MATKKIPSSRLALPQGDLLAGLKFAFFPAKLGDFRAKNPKVWRERLAGGGCSLVRTILYSKFPTIVTRLLVTY
jgi:hypothetical protein